MYLSLALACVAPLHLLDGPRELLFLWFVLIALPRTQWLTWHTCGGLWHGHTYNHIYCTPGEDTHTHTHLIPYVHLPHQTKPELSCSITTLVCGQLSMWVWDRPPPPIHTARQYMGISIRNGRGLQKGPGVGVKGYGVTLSAQGFRSSAAKLWSQKY